MNPKSKTINTKKYALLFVSTIFSLLLFCSVLTMAASEPESGFVSTISSSNIASYSATIYWITNEASDTKVEYGTTTDYGYSTSINTNLSTSHSKTLSGLSDSTLYHYRVKSKDAAGNLVTSPDQTFTTSPPPDTTPPTISTITSSDPASSSANISWNTNEASDTQVEYGTTTEYGSSTTLNTNLATSHSQDIVGLSDSTLYHYIVKSKDAAGNLATSADQTFTTSTDSGVIASWKFDENTGIIATDSSGNSNDGTISGATSTQGIVGNALSFNGNSNYVEVQKSSNLDSINKEITIEAWINTPLTTRGTIVEKWQYNPTNDRSYALTVETDGTVKLELNGNGVYPSSREVLSSSNKVPANTWTHIAVTSDGTTMRTYINGNPDSNTAVSPAGGIYISNANLHLGVWQYSPTDKTAYFSGSLDQVKIYNHALSDEEILAAYNENLFDTTPPTTSGPDSSFIASWKFDENTGIIATDSSGNNNDGTISGSTWTAGKIGNALSFDGVNDYVNAGNGESLNINGKQMTIETWVYPKSLSDNYIISKYPGSATTSGYNLLITDNNIAFRLGDGATRYQVAPVHGMSINTWYHVVAVYDGTSMKIYKDGTELSGSTPFSGNIGINSYNVNIGQRVNNKYRWNGNIDEVKIYNRALSSEEILANFNAIEENPTPTPTPTPTLNPWDNPTGNPVGGGAGYSNIIDPADATYIVSTKSELLSALSSARSGDIVYVTDSASIDLTSERNIAIPAGVTLASGRGRDGSQGALLQYKHLESTTSEVNYKLFVPSGDGVRITGFRIDGTDVIKGKVLYDHSVTYAIYSSYSIEVDNNEIYGFSQSAISISYAPANSYGYIHHNYIHHNLRGGLGYGVQVAYPSGINANVMIEANMFDWNRHSVTGTGDPNMNYIARYNIQLGNGISSAFDVHGYSAPPTYKGGIAGDTVLIYGNTFYSIWTSSDTKPPGWYELAINIRGVPTNKAEVYGNYFNYDVESSAIRQRDLDGNTVTDYNYINMDVHDNCYNCIDLTVDA